MSCQNYSQPVSSQSKRSRNTQDSDEEIDEDPCSQFINSKEDIIKDCLLYILTFNSTLLPIKKSDIFSKFSDKLGQKQRNAIIETLKDKFLTIGACLKSIDGNRFILVNICPKISFSNGVTSPERQLLQLVLSLIAVNKGTMKKSELSNFLTRLGINLVAADPYFGDVNKSLVLFEKQCYLKKYLMAKDTSSITYEWGIRAKCEVDKNAFKMFISSQMSGANINTSRINLSLITPPEDSLDTSRDQ